MPPKPGALRPRSVLAAAILLALALGLWFVLPAARAGHVATWPGGVVRIYDASGMHRTIATAAQRWNESGAHVRLVSVASPREADVVIRVDDKRLRGLCGGDCLGYSSNIGRPSDGRGEVLLLGELGERPRALSVWVAAHELGHVLGLRHRGGHACSLMSEHAFDTRCAPSLDPGEPTASQLACVPAPSDVDVAAKLYGGAAVFRDPRCR